VRDIDRIIAAVRKRLPRLAVDQHKGIHPGDADGLWWFWRAGAENAIQLESSTSTGMCPFLVEHDGMKTSAEAWWAGTIDEAAQAVVEYLAVKPASDCRDA
jgi:hypothetical protein